MADKRISDFPTVTEAKDDDLLLIDSEQETYNIKMLTIRQAALSMVQDEVNKMNSAIKNIDSAVAGVQDNVSDLSESVRKNALALLEKVDGAYVGDDGCLYLTADDAVVVGPLGPFAGTGGGSGGGSGNNATLTLTNTSGWLAATVAQNSSCVIKANWSSLENDFSTGAGTLTLRVNGSTKTTRSVDQGDISIDVKDFLNSGSNSVKLTITDVYGNNRTINFSITVVSVSLSSTFDETVIFTGAIAFTYIPVGNIEKTVHFILDGREIDTAVTSVSGRQQSYLIPAQTHGTHALQVYFTCDVDGNEIRSNELYYEIICAVDGDMHPAIASNYRESEVVQYTSIPITYRVYDPSNMTTEVKQYANDELVSTQTVDRTEQTWTYRADKTGSLNLRIDADNGYATASKSWDISVTESNIDVSAETEDLSLYLSSYGRSNNEENPGVWSYKDIAATFTNFNFVSDGWQMDKDKISVLRVAGDARLEIPLKIFEKDFRSTGKTIELEFSTGEVMDYDAVILSCMSGGRGIELTAQRATMKSEQSEIFTSYKEDEHIRIAFVVEKRSENRLIQCYINGIMSGAVQYPTDDDFSQQSPVNISIGSNDCALNLYCIRVYDNNLTRYQLLDNWVADSQNVDDLLARNARNDLFDAYGSIVIDKLPNTLPYLVITAGELPTYKGDKKIVSGYYVDPQHPERSFTFENAEIDVQGTSSAGYERKNFKIKFKAGFVINGKTVETYALRGDTESVPTNTFTFKADVASSEGANNVELVRLYDDICPYKTPPQERDSRVRQGIDGFPIVIFQDDGKNVTFIGKYNFNNDKGTEEVYGLSVGDESWEIRNNTSSRVNWKSADYTGTDWLNDFEGRYPDGNTDPANLAALAEWIVSTDRSVATDRALGSAVKYEGKTYTRDTAEYRLAKFRNEVTEHFEKDALLFNYLFTELFLMVDNRAKNAFPTFFDGHKWIIFPYDYDTAIGINNEGALVFDYSLEDTDKVDGANVYNGQESVLWVNVRDAFHDELASMYQTLRSEGKLSYADTEQRFEEHQSKWPEAIFNEDAWFKYLAPLVEKGNAAYLAMLQGSKAEQRKWWLYNRYRYIDSKYNAGDALSDFIMVRAYAKNDITVTPYASIYATIKYGSYLVQKRALRGAAYALECPLDEFNDTEIYIYSSSQLKSVGNLSGLMVGYADFSKAVRLQSLKLGDGAEDYSNPNMKELYLGNNTLLKTIDLRNCPNLAQTVDVSGCSNLEYVYFDGTSIPSITLPAGGIMKTLHLPATVANLTIRNQNGITEFVMPTYENITTLWLENVGNVVDSKEMVQVIKENSRVRIIGLNWTFESIEDALALFDVLDGMRGLDENGNNTDTAQVSGTIYVPTLTGAQMADIQKRYPSIRVTYEHITSYCYFYNYDGSTLLYTAPCVDGSDASYGGSTPTRPSTAQYNYSFAGWGLMPGGSVNSDALKNVSADRKVYAIFSGTVRTYTVYFYNGSTLLQTVTNVAYGSSATYTGDTPVSPDGSAEDYPFEGWNPEPKNITGTTSCYAKFGSPLEVKEITDSWETIIAACADGSYRNKYKVGNYKALDLGVQGVVNMQIAGVDKDTLADGSGKAPLSWISKELLTTSHRMNPSLVTNYNTYQKTAWVADEDQTNGWKSNNQKLGSTSAVAEFTVNAVSYGTLTVSYKVASEANYDKLTVVVNGTTVANAISGNQDWADYTVECSSGDTVTVKATYSKDGSGDSNGDTAYVKFSSDGTITVTANITDMDVKEVRDYQIGTGSIGGWENSEMRSYLKETVKPLIPDVVRNAIVEVTKTQNAYNTSGSSYSQTTTDDVWIPDYYEVFSNPYLYKGLFPDNASRIKYKVGATSASWWWLRRANYYYNFDNVYSSGISYSNGANLTNGVALGFCT